MFAASCLRVCFFQIDDVERSKESPKQSFLTTLVYNLISVPQITRLLLEDAIISSKTDPRNSNKKEN